MSILLTLCVAPGLVSGVTVDVGDGLTTILPVYDGNLMQHATRSVSIGGRHVTEYLTEVCCHISILPSGSVTFSVHYRDTYSPLQLLRHRGWATDKETMRLIKEKLCYVAGNVDLEQQLADNTTALVKEYRLPDGQVISLGAERFQAAEVLFQPSLTGIEGLGIAELLFDCAQVRGRSRMRHAQTLNSPKKA